MSITAAIDLLSTDWKPILKKINPAKLALLNTFHASEIKTYEPAIKILPPQPLIFSAFDLFDFAELRTVFIFQDPYRNIDKKTHIPEAHGLAISVPDGVKTPPSLRNFIKELKDDIPDTASKTSAFVKSTDLTEWATNSKTLLLNSALTLRQHNSNSHATEWQPYTDSLIKYISTHHPGVIFVLLGNWAKRKSALIDESKHPIITAAHPSPLSAHRGFFGSKIFSRCNTAAEKLGYKAPF